LNHYDGEDGKERIFELRWVRQTSFQKLTDKIREIKYVWFTILGKRLHF
jgi:hypothetical protein